MDSEFYVSAADAMEAPFEPKTPCRIMETRPCVVLTLDDSRCFTVNECPPNECVRFEKKEETHGSTTED
jgi:hypothetical protein